MRDCQAVPALLLPRVFVPAKVAGFITAWVHTSSISVVVCHVFAVHSGFGETQIWCFAKLSCCRSPKANAYEIRTVDLTPPVFTGYTPYLQNVQATAFDLVVQQNKGGRVFYTVVQQAS